MHPHGALRGMTPTEAADIANRTYDEQTSKAGLQP